MQGAPSSSGLVAQTRVGSKEHLHQHPALLFEFAESFIHRLQQPQRQKVDAHLERQAGIVKKAANIAIECADGLKLRRVEQRFRHPDESFVCIHFYLG